MAKLPPIRIALGRNGEIYFSPLLLSILGVSSGDSVQMCVSWNLKKIFVAPADIAHRNIPSGYCRPWYGKVRQVKNRNVLRVVISQLFQMAGPDLDVGMYSTYERVYDGEKVVGMVMSRNARDKRKPQPGIRKQEKGLTESINANLQGVYKVKRFVKVGAMSYLTYHAMKNKGYITRHGIFSQKVFNTSKDFSECMG